MAQRKWKYYVAIIPEQGRIKYITSVGPHHTASWEEGRPAKAFSKEVADDICEGLLLNYITAAVVKTLEGVPVSNPLDPIYRELWYEEDITEQWPESVPKTEANIKKAIKAVQQMFDHDQNVEYRNEAIGGLLVQMEEDGEFDEEDK